MISNQKYFIMNSIYAVLHNESALFILNNVEKIPKDQTEAKSLVKDLNQKFLKKYNIPFKDYSLPEYPADPNEIDLREWISKSSQSTSLKKLANKTIDIIDKEPKQTDFYNQLDDLLKESKEQLDENDFYKFQDHILVAKRSYQLWFSEIDGRKEWIGEVRKVKLPDPVVTSRRINGWKVLGVNCIGGLVGGPVGYLGSSGIAVIMMW